MGDTLPDDDHRVTGGDRIEVQRGPLQLDAKQLAHAAVPS